MPVARSRQAAQQEDANTNSCRKLAVISTSGSAPHHYASFNTLWFWRLGNTQRQINTQNMLFLCSKYAQVRPSSPHSGKLLKIDGGVYNGALSGKRHKD
jgi:hypothetical protein